MARQLLYAAAVLATLVRADDEAEAVLVATDANWKDIVESEPLILVEFYAPWCGHCKQLTPKYEAAAKILLENDPPIRLAKVDATEEKVNSGKAGVSGYPTLKMYRNGVASDYGGERETDGIVSYMKGQVGPSALPVTDSKHLKEVTNKKIEQVTLVGYFPTQTTAMYKDFMVMADKLRGKFDMYVATAPSVLEGAGFFGSNSAVIMYRPWAGKHFKLTFKGKAKLADWVVLNAFAPVTFANDETMELISKNGKPLFRAYVSPSSRAEVEKKIVEKLTPVQKEFDDKLTFVINEAGFEEFSPAEADLKAGNVFVIDDGRKKYVYTEAQGSISEWVKKWSKKKADAFVKSEKPAPKVDAGEVQVVVGTTFDDLVMDPTKNVLIEFYAPWCGHCKSLEPKYVELAKLLKDDKNIVIAKMDATANDVTHKKYKASGFPTILFAPASKGGKDEPLTYDGAREADEMASWVREKAL